jgi:c-di-GMP-binding flagellar brake protein YcgR
VGELISMDKIQDKGTAKNSTIRDRRYAIRYPFAADAELLNMESGARANGVTSDISMGGCFICSSRQFPVGARARLILTRKTERVEILAAVRVVKPRIGMGLEFLDIDAASHATLQRWMEQLRRTR